MSCNSTLFVSREYAINQIVKCVSLLDAEDLASLLYDLYGRQRCNNYIITGSSDVVDEEQEEL